MKKRYTFISLALLLLIPVVVCYLYLFGRIRNFSLCEKRFDGVLLEEFAELNKAKITKVVVDFRNSETPTSITDREKIEAALEFMKGRNNNWQKPCLVPVSDLVRLSFIDKTGAEIAGYGFWSGFIVYYGYSKQKNLPPVLLLPVNDEEFNALFEALEVPIELVNKKMGLEQ
jgi:hypothetical protein